MQDTQKKDQAIVVVIAACLFLVLLCIDPIPAQPSISVTVSGDITDMQLTPGLTNQNSSVYLTVTAANATSWYVDASDPLPYGKTSATKGYMAEYNGTNAGYVSGPSFWNLTYPLCIKTDPAPGGGITGTNGTISENSLTVYSGSGNVTSEGLPLIFSQRVTLTDPHLINGDTYRIDISFTGGVVE